MSIQNLIISTLQSLPLHAQQSDAEKALLFVCDRLPQRHFTFIATAEGGTSFVLMRHIDKLINDNVLIWDDIVEVKNIGYDLIDHLGIEYATPVLQYRNRIAKAGLESTSDYIKESYKHLYLAGHGGSEIPDQGNGTKIKIMTTGYEGTDVDEFISRLSSAKVTMLVDVRANAISRKFGFSKTRLSEVCKASSIQYTHESKLGIPSKDRKFAAQADDWHHLFQAYDENLPRLRSETDRIFHAAREGQQICLMCFEHAACDCHRSYLANHMEHLYGTKRVDL